MTKKFILALILIFLSATFLFAAEISITKSGEAITKYTDAKGKQYFVKDIALDGFTLKKPVIDEAKILSADEKAVVETSLKKTGRGLIHTALKPAKNDYTDDKHRGTVDYTTACHNYSFHKVIIPDGTIIREANFTQREINTDAIQGENLTFIECNLVNVRLKASWHLESCNTSQVDFAAREAEELAKMSAKEFAEVVK